MPTDLRLEGTLFPATYDVAEEDVADEARFLQRMADTFDQRYENLLGEVGATRRSSNSASPTTR